jgi:hypothetical protein
MVAVPVDGWRGVVAAAGIASGWVAGHRSEQADAVARGQSEFGFGWAELVAAQDGHASAARRRGEPAVMVISLNRYPGSGSAGAAGEIPVGVVPAGGGLGLPVRW